jgi:hypothetical protein
VSTTRALLESDRAITQTNERTLIKQLGSWLGLLTFAKNKPVLAKDMDLKQLIADAYTRGRMIAVLPFVEKVLSGCKDTKVKGVVQLCRLLCMWLIDGWHVALSPLKPQHWCIKQAICKHAPV